PQNLVTGFAAGLDRARMHRLPEDVGRSLRHYADDTAGAAITAGGGQHEQHNGRKHDGRPSVTEKRRAHGLEADLEREAELPLPALHIIRAAQRAGDSQETT